MRKLYEFCKLYNLDMEVEYDEINDKMKFRFCNRKTRQVYINEIPCYDIEHIENAEKIEEYLCENAIELLELDETLWTEEKRFVVCDECKGSGVIYSYATPIKDKRIIVPDLCPYCDGKGYTYISKYL